MKAYYIFQQADEETISNILDWMRNQERAIYRAAVRELGALKKLRPEFIQRKPLQEQFSFIKKMLSWKPSNEIGDHLLQVWLLRKHQDMLITFLNTLGIPMTATALSMNCRKRWTRRNSPKLWTNCLKIPCRRSVRLPPDVPAPDGRRLGRTGRGPGERPPRYHPLTLFSFGT